MSIQPPQPEFIASDASMTTSAGHNALYWVVAGGLLVTGVGATTMSLLLPTDDQQLVLPRILSTAIGVVLTALSSAVVAYLLTRIVTVSDVERRYIGVLDRIARSLAHVYANLQLATSQRRSGAYAHEETYQEVILAGASSVLAEFDSVTRLSGSISGAFEDSKRELDEVRSIFGVDPVVAQTITVARLESSGGRGEPVTVACPKCASRVSGRLLMRAGWTSTVTCQNCRSTFNLHRKGDLTVYPSAPRTPVLAESHDSTSPFTGANPVVRVEAESPLAKSPASRRVPEGTLSLVCPSCSSMFEVRYRSEQVKGDGTLARMCVACACRYRVKVDDASIVGWDPGTISSGVIVARRASHVLVECSVDAYPLLASFPAKNGNWHAFCISHQVVMAVTRKTMREWMSAHDPAFLATRLRHEGEGGARVLSDE